MSWKHIITARVGSMREGNVYTWECLSVHTQGGTPSTVMECTSILPDIRGGTPFFLLGAPPSWDWMVTPPSWDWMGCPTWDLIGYPLIWDWMEVPPPPGPWWGSPAPVRVRLGQVMRRSVCLLQFSTRGLSCSWFVLFKKNMSYEK